MRLSSRFRLALLVLLSIGAIPSSTRAQTLRAQLEQQVEEAERAFAKTFTDRDHAGFTHYLSDEAVFFGEDGPMRGRDAVAAGWRPLFEGPAPFSWEPDLVEVLESGTLALSSGVVRNPAGEVVARFNSIWLQEEPGVWRVVFDRGQPVCPP